MKRFLAAIVAILGVVSVSAQRPGAAGVWYGIIGPARDNFQIVVKLEDKSGGIWAGTVQIMNQNGAAIPLSKITSSGEEISFSIGGPQGDVVFKGTLSPDHSAIEGDFTQDNIRLPFRLSRNVMAPAGRPDGIDARELMDQVTSFPGSLSDRPFVAPLGHPAIEYGARSKDAVARLAGSIDAGQTQLNFDAERSFVRSVLDALKIPVESQVAVFTQTSLQGQRIGPSNPRTIFFNDSVAMGWVRGGFIELAAQDPQQGLNFYMLLPGAKQAPLPASDRCLGCHLSRNSLDVPGTLARSHFPDPNGLPLYQYGTHLSDHRTPFDERWGGWYVTGSHGSMKHMGNAMVTNRETPESMVTPETLNVKSLKGKFDTDAFLSPHSDIVALMVFDHQMHLMNLLTRIGWDFRIASFLEEATKSRSEALAIQRREAAKEFVDYLLFVDEAPFTNKVEGASGFAEKFAGQGPADSKGRSLRQFDLERRLMRYPCSYMIYSEAFDGLPAEAKDAIFQRMWQILSGDERDKKYARLSPADRLAILEILRDTKKDLPDYFK